ncbi:MAG: hypothetical protein PHU71_04755 [Candidatus Gracilibacteria bacterium]|nr:hypothetical protein [Candidatus Gracilibacteria bacterium]
MPNEKIETEEQFDDLSDVPGEWKNATPRALLAPAPGVEEDPVEKAYRLRVARARSRKLCLGRKGEERGKRLGRGYRTNLPD